MYTGTVFRLSGPAVGRIHHGIYPVQKDDSKMSARFQLRVIPGASRDDVAGEIDGIWRIRLRARPIQGQANNALIAFLADRFGIRARDVTILKGLTSREKLVEVHGVSSDEVRSRLEMLKDH